jgi:hypothetical protein
MFCLLLVGRRKKRKEKKRSSWEHSSPGPEAGYALLAMPGRIFMAVRYK